MSIASECLLQPWHSAITSRMICLDALDKVRLMHDLPLVSIESIKTTSLKNVSTGVLEKIKNNIQEVQVKPKMICYIKTYVIAYVKIQKKNEGILSIMSTWGPPGADRTKVGPMLTTWTLLSRTFLTLMAHFKKKSSHCLLWFGDIPVQDRKGACVLKLWAMLIKLNNLG